MKNNSSRRDFLKASVVGAAGAGLARLPATAASPEADLAKTAPQKAVVMYMLPKELSYEDRFKLAKDTGFEYIEAQTVVDMKEAESIKAAADKVGVKIHSVMNMAHWENPFSSTDPAVIEKGMDGMRKSLRQAKLYGADAVLLVPAVVNPKTRYIDAWTRSQKHIRQLVPLAAELKIVIAIEEVWNKFLLSPLEMAKYIDEFKSPWVKSYLDVGNMLLFGYPQDWIRTLGKRICKVHLKDFKFKTKGFSPLVTEFVELGEGDVDWPEVRRAFAEVGYQGVYTCELSGGDEAYFRDLSGRVDRLVFGKA